MTALRNLLRAHGMICNGGVFHAFETLGEDELEAAKRGYDFFGLSAVVELLNRAEKLIDDEGNLGENEARLDREYEDLASDAELVRRFRRHYAAKPSDFAPPATDG